MRLPVPPSRRGAGSLTDAVAAAEMRSIINKLRALLKVEAVRPHTARPFGACASQGTLPGSARGRMGAHVACGRPALIARRVLACDDGGGPRALGLLAARRRPARADDALVRAPTAAAPAANPKVISLATRAAECARKQGLLDGFRHLAVIDYSLPSTQPRLWVFDVTHGRLLYQELVAHGRNTGERVRRAFLERRRQQDVEPRACTRRPKPTTAATATRCVCAASMRASTTTRCRARSSCTARRTSARRSRSGWAASGRSWGCPAVRSGSGARRDRHA